MRSVLLMQLTKQFIGLDHLLEIEALQTHHDHSLLHVCGLWLGVSSPASYLDFFVLEIVEHRLEGVELPQSQPLSTCGKSPRNAGGLAVTCSR